MGRETREAWAERVERWQGSGLTAKGFARREGVNPHTLTYWKWRLSRDGDVGRGARRQSRRRPAAGPVDFVELVAPRERLLVSESGAALELVLASGHRVRLGSDFEGDALGRLLDVLEARR